MKARKLKASQSDPQTPTVPGSNACAEALNNEFDAFCQQYYPDEFAEPEDQHTLRTVWMASAWHTSGQLLRGSVEPLHQIAGAEFRKLQLKPINKPETQP